MKTKDCPKCELSLPLEAFTSTRAKYCKNCKIIRKMEQQKASRQRQIDRLSKKKQKTKGVIRVSDLKKKVQRVFNKWIRTRDAGLPCISCGKISDKVDAGHYIAQGSSGELRYNENNVHLQCTACNRFKHGNLIEYRIGLIEKIGENQVVLLEKMRNKTKKWTREELTELLERYS